MYRREKKQYIDFMKANLNEKLKNVTKIVTVRLQKEVNKMWICLIKKDELSISGASDYNLDRLRSPNVVKFGEVLFKRLKIEL